jgi:hypothetical protein
LVDLFFVFHSLPLWTYYNIYISLVIKGVG